MWRPRKNDGYDRCYDRPKDDTAPVFDDPFHEYFKPLFASSSNQLHILMLAYVPLQVLLIPVGQFISMFIIHDLARLLSFVLMLATIHPELDFLLQVFFQCFLHL